MSRTSPSLRRDGRSRVAWIFVLFVLAALALWLSFKADRERPPEVNYAGSEVPPRTVYERSMMKSGIVLATSRDALLRHSGRTAGTERRR